MAMREPGSVRWRRRARTIPLVLVATAAAVVAAPAIVVAAVAWDAVRLRWRWPTLRVYGFALQYLLNDVAEILASGAFWVAAGLGTRLGSDVSVRRHVQLERWSLGLLARRADQLLGLRIQLEPGAADALLPAPAIVLSRHVNLFDASLPLLVFNSVGCVSRCVIMAELMQDPGLDLMLSRLGSVFIARDRGPDAQALVSAMGADLDDRTVAAIFPEGGLYRPEVAARLQAKLRDAEPDRARRTAGLRHVLPPHPAGTFALLDAAPGRDVVVLAHVGLDRHPSLASLVRAVPLHDPVRVMAWRIPRAEVPAEPEARTVWLDEVWQQVDDWVHDQMAA